MRPDGRPSGPGYPAMARVFFALWPDPGLAAALGWAAVDGAARLGGRATQTETLHLTLAFLGDIAVDRLDALRSAAATVRAPAFVFTLDRLGYWRHNHLLWAGGEGGPGLTGLVRALGEALQAAGFKYDSGGRAFVPHLTLVRNVRTVPTELPAFSAAWECREFVLVRSRLAPAGAAYERLGHWPLVE